MQNRSKIEAEVKAYETLGCRAEFAMPDALPLKTQGAVRLDRQAQFHPLKFIAGIVKGLNIYENSFVRSLDGLTARTDEATVTAKKIIVATHFRFLTHMGVIFEAVSGTFVRDCALRRAGCWRHVRRRGAEGKVVSQL